MAGSEEHIFPEAIGGSLVMRQMCKSCNSRWGARIDGPLSNHTLVAMRRLDFGLEGKSGKIPNPFSVGTLVSDPKQKVFTGIGEPVGQARRPFFHDRVERVRRPDGGETIRVSGDASRADELRAIVGRISERAARDGRPVTTKGEPIVSQSTDVEVHVGLSVDIWRWKTALAKIAYECACVVVGEDLLDDPLAADIRRRLEAEPSAKLFDGLFARFGGPGGLTNLDLPPGWHYACVAQTPQGLLCHARVFELFEVRLLLTTDPRLAAKAGAGRCFFVDAKRGRFHVGGPDDFVPEELETDLIASDSKARPPPR